MKKSNYRPSYRKAVKLIAHNDSNGEDTALDVQSVSELVTVGIVADLFDIETTKLAQDIVKERIKASKLLTPFLAVVSK